MIVDRYTKAVLTVIAGCLLWICAMGAGQSASAQTAGFLRLTNAQVQPIVIVGTGTLDSEGTVTVNYVQQNGTRRTDPTLPVALPYTDASPMPARLTNAADAPVPVEISAVRKVGEWEPIRASVEDAPMKKRPGGGGDH